MLKDLDVGNDAYELSKTAQAPHLILSDSALQVCKQGHSGKEVYRQHNHRDEHTGARHGVAALAS